MEELEAGALDQDLVPDQARQPVATLNTSHANSTREAELEPQQPKQKFQPNLVCGTLDFLV